MMALSTRTRSPEHGDFVDVHRERWQTCSQASMMRLVDEALRHVRAGQEAVFDGTRLSTRELVVGGGTRVPLDAFERLHVRDGHVFRWLGGKRHALGSDTNAYALKEAVRRLKSE